jgi:hypothetical protein
MTNARLSWNAGWLSTFEAVLGHIAAIIVGFIMMVVGLGLGVTMIMLPVGLVIGLIGMALFIGGLFVHIDDKA